MKTAEMRMFKIATSFGPLALEMLTQLANTTGAEIAAMPPTEKFEPLVATDNLALMERVISGKVHSPPARAFPEGELKDLEDGASLLRMAHAGSVEANQRFVKASVEKLWLGVPCMQAIVKALHPLIQLVPMKDWTHPMHM
jgi:hypothetical protein